METLCRRVLLPFRRSPVSSECTGVCLIGESGEGVACKILFEGDWRKLPGWHVRLSRDTSRLRETDQQAAVGLAARWKAQAQSDRRQRGGECSGQSASPASASAVCCYT